MSTPADFAGRRFDVAVLRGQRPSGDALASQDILASGGQACAGILKLAQWFVATLLKEQGSMPFDPTSGTTFYTKLASGRLRTAADVFVAFGFAVGDVQAQAKALETAATPADEQFAGAVLDRVEVGNGGVRLHVTLSSAAGTSRAVLLPIPAPAP